MKFSSLFQPIYLIKRGFHRCYELRHPEEPWITRGAIDFCKDSLSSEFIALEWGSGRSTLWFANRVGHLTSVEHDEEWFQNISQRIKENHLQDITYLYRPLGHPPSQVIPFEERLETPYVRVADLFQSESLDLVIVDGHYREACIAAVLPKLRRGGLLLLDNSNWLPLDQWNVPSEWGIVHQSFSVNNQTTVWRKGNSVI